MVMTARFSQRDSVSFRAQPIVLLAPWHHPIIQKDGGEEYSKRC